MLQQVRANQQISINAYSAACQDEADAAQGLVRALESALKTAAFERHPHRGWQGEARAAIQAFKGDTPSKPINSNLNNNTDEPADRYLYANE